MFPASDPGDPIVIRPIAPNDKFELEANHRRLSAETVRRRYLGAKPRLSSSDLRYLTEVDGVNHVALVAVRADDPSEIVGVGRWVRLPAEPQTAEFAIVVRDEFQGAGVGSYLAEALSDAALARGIRRFTATTLADNAPIRRLLARLGRRLEHRHVGGGVDEVLVELAA